MTTTLTSDVARTLGGPGWLVDRRVAAAESIRTTAPPTAGEEVWRYSPIGQLDLERFPLADPVPPASQAPDSAAEILHRYPSRCGAIVISAGSLVYCEINDPAIVAASGAQHPRAAELLGAAMAAPVDFFAVLNDAFHRDAAIVSVAPQIEVTNPLVVVHLNSAASRSAFPRLIVEVGAGARLTVIDHHVSGGAASFAAPVAELIARRDASLRYLNIQLLDPAAWQIASQVVRVEEGASFAGSNAAFGGDYARVRTDCTMAGRGAESRLTALYFGTGSQTLDFRVFQDHAARDTTSDLVFKGAVDDRSRSIFTGLIRVRAEAAGTSAFQTNRNIKLSDEAWAESVPNLEIHNNDVRCSHASTVGPIDDEQRFYLESRGVPPDAAEKLIVAGFFREVIDGWPEAAAADLVRRAVAERLDPHETR